MFEFGLVSHKLCQFSIDALSPSPNRWSAPYPGTLTINCDVAYFKNLKLGLAAFVIRDWCLD